MDPVAILIATLAVLPAIGVVLWAAFVMAQVDDDMRSSREFEIVRFDTSTSRLEDRLEDRSDR